MDKQEQEEVSAFRKRVRKTLLFCALIALGSLGAVVIIKLSEPSAQKSNATRKSAALVEVTTAQRGDYAPQIKTLGTVQAAQEVVLRARVSGYVVGIAPEFEPGAIVQAGEPLLSLDERDYEIARALRQSDLDMAKAELAQEEGRQQIARAEYEVAGEAAEPQMRSLMLRQPQLTAVKARVEAAQANYDQAVLNQERAQVRAPFAGKILERGVDVGSVISTAQPLGRLVGTDEFWVVATVSAKELHWLHFAGSEAEASTARLHHRGAWEPTQYREGKVLRLIGSLDENSKLAKVLISLDDPLALHSDDPVVLLGSVLDVSIEGQVLPSVVRVPREHLRQGSTLWVMHEGQLSIRSVELVFSDADYAYIKSGVEAGEQIVTTNLATVKEGIALQITSKP